MPSSPPGPNDTDRLQPEDAFAALGNETRIGILLALWDAFESGIGDNALSYSELFDQVDYDDSGNFNYHLERLIGSFVRRTEEGYELKQTGINVVRAAVKGTVTDDPSFGPTPIDPTCPICDGPLVIAYADELLTVSCTACEGRMRWKSETGHLFGALVPPRSIVQRSQEEGFQAAVVYVLHQIASFHDGVCAECSGPVRTTVDVCTDHEPGDGNLCAACEQFHMAEVRMVCSTCKLRVFPPGILVVLDNPDVTAFYNNHDVEHRFATWETVVRSYHVGEELVSREPWRVRFSVPAAEDELQLTVDEDFAVVESSQ